MSLSVNDQSPVPPGFRFHPTEEELLHCYLRKKVAHEEIHPDVIRVIDLNKLEPWDIQEKCKVGSTQIDCYFFSHKDKKYPTGTRTNRATAAGFWKATGRDKAIYSSCKRIGMRKTLVFYKGRAPYGQKSDWIMHEYRLDNQQIASYSSNLSVWKSTGQAIQEEEWVVCHMFKKRKYHKAGDSPKSSAITIEAKTQIAGASDQILQYMGGIYKLENEAIMNNNGLNIHTITTTRTNYNSNRGNMRFLRPTEIATSNEPQERSMHLSALVSENCGSQACYPLMDDDGQMLLDADLGGGGGCTGHLNPVYHSEPWWSDWAALDPLVASHLNGQEETCNTLKHLACFNETTMTFSSPAPLLLREDDDDQDGLLPSPQLRSCNPSTSVFNTSHHNNNDCNSEIDLWNFTKSPSSSSDPLCHVSNTSW